MNDVDFRKQLLTWDDKINEICHLLEKGTMRCL
jgi:hypothetical protein